MKFWDSSALVPLVLEEPSSTVADRLFGDDPDVAAWWATRVECAAAIARRARLVQDDVGGIDAARRLDRLAGRWLEIPPGERLRELAVRAVHLHDLRAGDALQLAAALVASEERPATLDFVTLDDRLTSAARREGFRVLPD